MTSAQFRPQPSVVNASHAGIRFEHSGAPASEPGPTGGVTVHSQNRRSFLANTAAALATVALQSSSVTRAADAPAEDNPPATTRGIIDAHSHIWTRDITKYPLANGNTLEDLKPPSFTAEELLAVARPLGVSRVVLIQHGPYHGFDNRYITDTIARYPDVFRGVAVVDSRSPNPAAQMQALHEKGITGFRIRPRQSGDTQWLREAGMQTMWRCGAERNLAMCPLIDPEYLPQIDAMCDQFRDTPVVVDHFGRIGIDGEIRESDLQALCRLARHPRVRVKVSAYYALGKKTPPYLDLKPMILRVLEAFGPERLMWASDAPYQLTAPHTYAASLHLIQKGIEELSEAERRWILGKTAEQTYFHDA